VLDQGDLDVLLGPPMFAGASFDPGDLGQQVLRDADELRTQLDLVGERQSRVQATFLVKQADQQAYDDMFLRTARVFEDTCRLIGRNDLADRVRPSTRRSGRTEEPPEELPEETAEEVQPEDAGSEPADSAPDPRGVIAGDSTGVEASTPDGG
jgi:hypothetical protein